MAENSSFPLTLNQALAVVATGLLGFTGFWVMRYIDKDIPAMVKAEVTDQLSSNVNAQIDEKIKSNFGSQLQANKEDLAKTIDDLAKTINENNKYTNDKIIGIYDMIQKAQMFGSALKRGTRRSHATLMRTLPVSRELLAHAKATAQSDPRETPTLTDRDFDEITNNLFMRYSNPVLTSELWDTLLELTSYKTVMNGIEFGPAQPSKSYAAVVSLNDREFYNDVIVGRTIVLGHCGVVLRNVRFVNCEFEVERGVNGDRLLRALLTSDKRTISLRLTSPPGYVKSACEK
jgi:hypothetical protein